MTQPVFVKGVLSNETSVVQEEHILSHTSSSQEMLLENYL